MFARLFEHALLRAREVAVCRPAMCGSSRDLLVAEVRRCAATVLRSEIELFRNFVVQLRCVAQFQTLTSR